MSRVAKIKREQPMPEDVVTRLVEFIKRKFYTLDDGRFMVDCFEKQRRDLLRWVVYFPARWLRSRGVTVAPRRYEDILLAVLRDALANMRAEKVKYLPAYLKMVVESHFDHQGEDYYEEAKATRNVVSDLVNSLEGRRAPERDIVEELVRLDRLMKATKGRAKASSIVGKQKELF